MPVVVLLTAVVILLCVFSDRISGKIGVPTLLIFIGIGIFFGCDGLVRIPFEDYSFASNLCECALIIIMFTGGFSMRWDSARPVMVKAGALATLGVAVTAGVTCAFCYFILRFPFAESLLLGSVISSTDAASVFSVLRSKKLNLKNGIAPLLEAESGSNDPFSYMLTVVSLSLFGIGEGTIVVMMLKQLVFGALFGVVVGILGSVIAKRFKTQTEEFECIMYLAFALMAYGFPALVGGNGYLSVYIAGIIIGNMKSPIHKYGGKSPLKKFLRNTLKITILKTGKKIAPSEAVVFLNGTTGICQIAVFFLLGLLCTPSQLVTGILPAIGVFLCLTLISRPLAVAIFGGKSPIRDRLFVSFCGLRGASSIVFAIMATVSGIETKHNIFNIVFCVCLMSMTIQGTLLPAAAKRLDLIDSDADVLKTFNDYREEAAITMMRMYIPENHNWDGRQISEISVPTGSLIVMVKRDEDTIIPRGDTVIRAGDSVILSVPPYESDKSSLTLREVPISDKHIWLNKKIRDLNLPQRLLIVMVQRGEQRIIPSGATEIKRGDVVVITDTLESAE